MTSDAKIGLLLGLAFIFMIAFLINGLPSFHNQNSSSELTINTVGSQNKQLGIASKAREVINQDVRFSTPLPKRPSATQRTTPDKPTASIQPLPKAEKKQRPNKVEPGRPALPKVYVVKQGDNLAVIAQKFYGPDQGNKNINVTRIFKANAKLLKSPDEIYEGQKLTIPPLSALTAGKNKINSASSTTILEKVKSITTRHKRYIVRLGDSLWQIAAAQLGDGKRYGEIAKLNGDILDNADSLAVGMRLKMPAR